MDYNENIMGKSVEGANTEKRELIECILNTWTVIRSIIHRFIEVIR